MATRLVADKLDLDLATLAAALLVVIVVVVGGAGAGALDSARFGRGAIAGGVLVKVGRRRLVVLVGDVGHVVGFCGLGITKSLKKAKKYGGDAVLSLVPMAYT